MPSTPFGDRLKREREMRGVSLDEVAAATRIAPKFLEALENERWDQLPGGVFNRGFIRSIARFLGLDQDSLVSEYDLVTQAQKPPATPAVRPPQFDRNWTPFILACLILLAILAGGFFLVARYAPRLISRLHHPHGAAAAPASTPAGATDSNPQATSPAPPTGLSESPSDAPAAAPSLAPSMAPSAAASVAPSAAAADDTLQLKLEAGKPAEVTILADGQQVFSGHVEPGDSREFQARENFQITSSEASALLLELNGQTVPPLGAPGEPGSVTLTRNDIVHPGGAH